MKRFTALILCAVIFIAAFAAAGMAVSVSVEAQNNDLSSAIRSGSSGSFKNTGTSKSTGFPSLLDRFPGQNNKPASNGPWLPDPCNVFGVSGELMQTKVISGTKVYFYSYEVDMSIEEMSTADVTYCFALMDLGYEVRSINPQGGIMAYALSKAGEKAEIRFQITDERNYYDEYSTLTWQVILAVPETMEFRLGRETPGIVDGHNVCPGCEGSKKCAFCHGYGKCNYGDGYEPCVTCDGNKVCTVCGGRGY